MNKIHQEVTQCFEIFSNMPKSPLQIHPGKESETWELCDADGVVLFTLIPGKSMVTSAELAGLRFVIENSITWLKGLLEVIKDHRSTVDTLEDNLKGIRQEIYKAKYNLDESFNSCKQAIIKLNEEE